nr:DoxX family protein [Rhodococcus corynebacterioides]
MLASIFVAGGVDALRNPSGRAKAAKPLIDKSQDVLPDEVTQNVPDDPETLVKINAAIQIGGGVLLATGKAPRIASAVLAGSLVPTTLAGHAFWEETDPEAKALQRTQFLKNVSLLGGLLIAAVDTEGKPSVAWRSKRAARNAKVAVAGALPLVSSSDTSDTLASASHKAKELAGVAAERVQPYAEVAAHKGAEQAAVLANVAQDRGGKLAALAKERSSRSPRTRAASTPTWPSPAVRIWPSGPARTGPTCWTSTARRPARPPRSSARTPASSSSRRARSTRRSTPRPARTRRSSFSRR